MDRVKPELWTREQLLQAQATALERYGTHYPDEMSDAGAAAAVELFLHEAASASTDSIIAHCPASMLCGHTKAMVLLAEAFRRGLLVVVKP